MKKYKLVAHKSGTGFLVGAYFKIFGICIRYNTYYANSDAEPFYNAEDAISLIIQLERDDKS